MKLVLMSDSHGMHRQVQVPEGDVLIHAGDITNVGEEEQYRDFKHWLGELPHRHKIVIAGNHDFNLKEHGLRHLATNAIYLEDTYVEIDGVLFYGSPYTKRYGHWAFMEGEHELEQRWKRIPHGTDVLITHGPPYNTLDQAYPGRSELLGSKALEYALEHLNPAVVTFGHIHGSRGQAQLRGTTYVNASVVNEAYKVVNAPQVVEI